jgi:hypothetical protein
MVQGFLHESLREQGPSFQWIELYLRRAHHAWVHISLLDLCCSLIQDAIVSGSFVSCSFCIPPSILHIYILPFQTSFPRGDFIQGHVDQKYTCSFSCMLVFRTTLFQQ